MGIRRKTEMIMDVLGGQQGWDEEDQSCKQTDSHQL